MDEIEVSLFGPGYGESILLHVGGGDWLIVDSCLGQAKQPAALLYLSHIGVDPASAVKQIVATHWHDDHIRGLAAVFAECASAEFVLSQALKSQEFLALVQAYGARSMMMSSGVEELYRIVQILEQRNTGPKFAIADRPIWKRVRNILGQSSQVDVYALSPSDASVLLAQKEIATLLPAQGSPKQRVVSQSPNHTATVIWVEVDGTSILLGSDLENTTDIERGWLSIINSATRPVGLAELIKLSHHGSVTGDHPRVWTEMLSSTPIAVLTPFSRGNVRLPTAQDVSRIRSKTEEAYASSRPKPSVAKMNRPKVVERVIAQTVREIRQVPYSTGQVRLRRKITNQGGSSPWRVSLFGTALPLKEFALITG